MTLQDTTGQRLPSTRRRLVGAAAAALFAGLVTASMVLPYLTRAHDLQPGAADRPAAATIRADGTRDGANPLRQLAAGHGNAVVRMPAGSDVDTSGSLDLDEFVVAVADDVDAYWSVVFEGSGMGYASAPTVQFDVVTLSGCGFTTEADGPVYCYEDDTVYLPDAFFVSDDVRAQDAAIAAVIAHEYGHHVQDLVGILEAEHEGRISSVQLELQADCLAGAWMASADERGMLEVGDLDEAIALMLSIGDDALGNGDPATYTHGSAEQRAAWFAHGFETGNGGECATYETDWAGTGDTTTDDTGATGYTHELARIDATLAAQGIECETRSDMADGAGLVCTDDDVTITYEAFSDVAEMDAQVDGIVAAHPEAVIDTWYADSPDAVLGMYVEVEVDDLPVIVWTYDEGAIVATVQAADGDLDRTAEYWSTVAAPAGI